MLWIITHATQADMQPYVGTGRFPPEHSRSITHARKIVGGDAAPDFIRGYSEGLPIEFQLLDGDDELYLSGRAQHLDGDGDECFEPLDFFEQQVGVVTMMWRQCAKDGEPEQEWQQL